MTLGKAIGFVESTLRRKGIEDADLEAKYMLSSILSTDSTQLYLFSTNEMNFSHMTRINEMISRRVKREPIQYIIGECGFLEYKFYLDKSVFIPRPETELLVLKAIDYISRHKSKVVYDIGTGCGTIALSLAKLAPDLSVYASDITDLRIARKNRKFLCVEDTVVLLSGSLFKPYNGLPKASLIISNPPYIPTNQIALLEPEIRNFEPVEGIDGGKDGLAFIRRLLSEAQFYLRPKGALIFEIGHGEWKRVEKIAKCYFSNVELVLDYNKKERVCICDSD